MTQSSIFSILSLPELSTWEMNCPHCSAEMGGLPQCWRAALMRLVTSPRSRLPLWSVSNLSNTASTAALSCSSEYDISQYCMIAYNRMDIARSVLDNLMGRDRNLAKNSTATRDHYSNSDVCKPFLVCFCFNTLFPNTTYDEGPCNKRHDTYLKTMFDNDPDRGEHERVYIRQCINWIQRRLQEVDQKTRKNQSTIENKSNSSGERPRQILDRIMSIDKDIDEMMKQAAIFGENGQIDDSARCLEEVDRLRAQRREVDLMGDNLLAVVKQQKICEVCGAIQTIGDTEKRVQMHLEGKIHQGFLKLKNEVETLKIRLEILDQKLSKDKDKREITPGNQLALPHSENYEKVKEQVRQGKEREPSRDRSQDKKKKKEHKHKEHKQHKEHKHKDRRDSREHKRHKDDYDRRDRSRQRHKESKKRDRRDHSYERDSYRDRHYR